MAEIRPFRGLRFDSARAGSLNRVIAPPYDVISPAQQRALHDVSPFNVVHVEYGLETGDARYATAARLMREWRGSGVLRQDPSPALYLYEQEFARHGQTYRRRALFGRVRLEPYEAGVVKPHEYTMSGPREDRLRLLRAAGANVSGIYAVYKPGAGDPLAAVTLAEGAPDLVHAVDMVGERHTLALLTDDRLHRQVGEFLANRSLYIADGHHRYETALKHREECRARASLWKGEEPENFVLMAVSPADDAGLLILPIHRLVRRAQGIDALLSRLERFFDVEPLPAANPADALAKLGGAGVAAFVGAGIVPDSLLALKLRDREAVEKLMPAERSAAWKALDVNVLQYGILDAALGISIDTIAAGGILDFTEDADEALAAVRDGHARLAFLVNPTRPEHIFSVADAGDRMPQKSTYFYPKLGTGLVMNPLE